MVDLWAAWWPLRFSSVDLKVQPRSTCHVVCGEREEVSNTRVHINVFCLKASTNMGAFVLQSSVFRNMSRCPKWYVEEFQEDQESVSS